MKRTGITLPTVKVMDDTPHPIMLPALEEELRFEPGRWVPHFPRLIELHNAVTVHHMGKHLSQWSTELDDDLITLVDFIRRGEPVSQRGGRKKVRRMVWEILITLDYDLPKDCTLRLLLDAVLGRGG